MFEYRAGHVLDHVRRHEARPVIDDRDAKTGIGRVAAERNCVVARSEDEATNQARGENVSVVKDEKIELETFNPDGVFEEGAAPSADEGDEG